MHLSNILSMRKKNILIGIVNQNKDMIYERAKSNSDLNTVLIIRQVSFEKEKFMIYLSLQQPIRS
jgi:hypothetical protein